MKIKISIMLLMIFILSVDYYQCIRVEKNEISKNMKIMLEKLRTDIHELKSINQGLKKLRRRDSSEEDELVISIKLHNITLISDLNMSISKYKNKMLKIDRKPDLNSTGCVIQLYITTDNNTNSTSNITTRPLNINYPDYESSQAIIKYLTNQTNEERQRLCVHCLDSIEYLDEVLSHISLISKDIPIQLNRTFTKPDLITKFSEYINAVNMIKIIIYEVYPSIKIMESSCEHFNYHDNYKEWESALHHANTLIESIQHAIRKQNLNVNFAIIS